ncbi:uncharacterized protein G2W53_003138 [Senna tora]|uniref:Uncharacterized protein n=1 Tax=Senna tora TaxID=362788 RepID=A0A835CI55_9FABA|nr:uncharacterized protein G2W53_003138 [Senna tora]
MALAPQFTVSGLDNLNLANLDFKHRKISCGVP